MLVIFPIFCVYQTKFLASLIYFVRIAGPLSHLRAFSPRWIVVHYISHYEEDVGDNIAELLKDNKWSVADVEMDGGWMAFAAKAGLQFVGQGDSQHDAWSDLLRKLRLAGQLRKSKAPNLNPNR